MPHRSRHRRAIPVLALLALTVLATSCAVPRVVREPADISYPGLSAQLRPEGGAVPHGTDGTLHIIVTHGMGHEPGDAAAFEAFELACRQGFARELGEEPVAVADDKHLLLDDPRAVAALRNRQSRRRVEGDLDAHLARLREEHALSSWTRRYRFASGRYHDVAFHWIEYSWYLTWIKAAMAEHDETLWKQSAYLLNRQIKQRVMNDGFPDAVIYLHPQHRQVLQDHFQRSFARIGRSMQAGDQVALVSSSLGSKVLLDSVRAEAGKRTESLSLAARTTHFFMFANQIPLLELGIQDTALQSLIDIRARNQFTMERRGIPSELTVIAFGDPSDLLTYHLLPERYRRRGSLTLHVANVEVRNPGLALWPVYRDPISAHTRYSANRHVMQRIVHGHGPGR